LGDGDPAAGGAPGRPAAAKRERGAVRIWRRARSPPFIGPRGGRGGGIKAVGASYGRRQPSMGMEPFWERKGVRRRTDAPLSIDGGLRKGRGGDAGEGQVPRWREAHGTAMGGGAAGG
jgi:hypothetical protein